MSSRPDVASWLPLGLGPLVLRVNGTTFTKRKALNFQMSGATVVQDPDGEQVTIVLPSAGSATANVATWMSTPSSANLLAALSDKTGTGLAVFATAPTFKTTITLRNPADTYSYTFTPGAILADRVVNLPVLGSDDTLVCLAATQTLTNKTVDVASNPITATSQAAGDLLVNNGTRFVRLAMGTALQVLRVNAGATALEWAAAGGSSAPTGDGLAKVVAGAFAGAASLLMNADVDAAAAIAGSKVSPDFASQTTTLGGMKRTPVSNATTGAINNLALASTTTIIVFTGAGAVTLSGVAGGADGRDLTIINATGDLLTIPDSSVLSDADKRFRSPYGASTIMQDGAALDFVYSAVTNKWHTKLSF